MIIPDANLLIYAYQYGSAHHPLAKKWWAGCLSGSELVGLPEVILFAFLRLSTSTRVFDPPFRLEEAWDHMTSWLQQSNVEVLRPGQSHVQEVVHLLRVAGATGNLVTDAQLAAIAIEYHALLHTTDADFLRFPGLRWFNPFTGRKTENPHAR